LIDVPSATPPAYGALVYVAAVNLVIWAGILAYLFYLDLKVRSAASQSPREEKP
jgi:CcmD family protein